MDRTVGQKMAVIWRDGRLREESAVERWPL